MKKKLILLGVATATIFGFTCLYLDYTSPAYAAKQKRLEEVGVLLMKTDWDKHSHYEYVDLNWEKTQLNMPSVLWFVGFGSVFVATMTVIIGRAEYGLFRKPQKTA